MVKNIIIVNISRDVIQEQIEKKDSKGIRYNSCRGVMSGLVRYDKKRRMLNDIKRDAMSKTLHERRTSNLSGYKSWVQSRKSTGNGRTPASFPRLVNFLYQICSSCSRPPLRWEMHMGMCTRGSSIKSKATELEDVEIIGNQLLCDVKVDRPDFGLRC
jgi:hypothetical protein